MQSRILTTYPWYKPAGLAPRLLRACRALAEAGDFIDWVAITPPPVADLPIKFHILGASDQLKNSMPDHKSRMPWAFYMWHGSRVCRRLAMNRETRALLAFSYGASFPLLPAQWSSRKPLVIFLRSNEQQENNIKGVSAPMKWLFRALERRAVRSARKIVPITAALADIMIQRHGEGIRAKLEVLHNNLPVAPDDIEACRKQVREMVKAPSAVVITSNGPFNERKNFSALIEAFSKTEHDNARLLLVGDGPLLSEHVRQAKRLSVADRVFFTGWRADAARLTAGSDLFVLPSQAEGVSNSLLEALAANVPCLVSDIPEHAEIFPDRSIRFTHDSVSELAAALRNALDDGAYRQLIRNQCRATAELLDFDWNKRIVEILDSLDG